MAFNYLFRTALFIMLFSITSNVFSQYSYQEKNINLKKALDAAELDSGDEVDVGTSIDNLKPFLDYGVKFSKQFNILSQEWANLKSNMDAANQRVEQYEAAVYISGVSEDTKDGNSLIISSGERYAIKKKVKKGKKYSGYIMPTDITISYYDYMEGSTPIPLYECVPAGFSSKDLSKYTDEKTALESKVNDFSQAYYYKVIGSIKEDIKDLNNSFMQKAYNLAEGFAASKDFGNAYKQYKLIEAIDPQYKDVPKKMNDAFNKMSFTTSLNLSARGQHLEAYTLLEFLVYSNNYEESRVKYQSEFELFYKDMMQDCINKNDIAKFISVFDTLDQKIKLYKNAIYFTEYKRTIKKDFAAFASNYFSIQNNEDKLFVYPEGSFLTHDIGQEIDVSPFAVMDLTFSKNLTRSYEIARGEKLSFENYNAAASTKQSKELKSLAAWLGLELVSDNDKEYINSSGWNSVKEKEYYAERNSQNYYNVSVTPVFKIMLNDIKDERIKSALTTKASLLKDATELKNERIKDNFLKQKNIYFGRYLWLTPFGGYSMHSILFPADLGRAYLNQGCLNYGIFVGYNMRSNGSSFSGFGINFNYSASLGKPSSQTVESFTEKGWELELQARSIIYIGAGFAKKTIEYSFPGGSPILSQDLNLFTVTAGFDFGYLNLYVRSYISSQKIGFFALKGQNTSGNLIGGANITIPIEIFKNEPTIF